MDNSLSDCNAGNLGCILGVRGGLETFEGGPDWRGPFADRVIIPTADGGAYATTASALTERIQRSATRLRNGSTSRTPRFNFALRDSVQGFQIDPRFESRNLGMISNDDGRMRIDFNRVATGNRFEFWTPTFIIPSDLATSGYGLYASPNLYSGQEVTCEVQLAPDSSGPVDVWLKGWRYGRGDEPESVTIGTVTLKPGANQTLKGVVPQPGWKPYFGIGFEIGSRKGANGALNVSNLDWNSPAKTTLSGPDRPGKLWLQQWVNGLSELRDWSGMDCVQNEGTGLATIGCREWQNYQASAKIQILGSRQAGIAVHVQGMRRYYALVLQPGVAKFIKSRDGVRELGSAPFAWAFDEIHDLKIEVQTLADSVLLKGWVDGELLIEATDSTRPLAEGAIGILVTEGRARPESVSIASLNQV